MDSRLLRLIDKLADTHSLSAAEYGALIDGRCEEAAAQLAKQAVKARRRVYEDKIFIRGLIEISSYCKNDCFYCGLRRSNPSAQRYRLLPDEIFSCCCEGYRLGFRTFVLQGGEDAFYTDELLCALLRRIKAAFPDCAVTLSLGERSRESYQALREAGADRYLLRHETANPAHYARLHPPQLQWENRMQCLKNLRALGYQVGCGFMVGTPYQTTACLVDELVFFEHFRPDMCGIGPFIPHHDTPFAKEAAGSVALSCYLLCILRLIHPPVLLPATTALGTLAGDGRERGILAGANVLMPNLSPLRVREKYALYDNKICTGEESAQCISCLQARMERIGYRLVRDRGDIAK